MIEMKQQHVLLALVITMTSFFVPASFAATSSHHHLRTLQQCVPPGDEISCDIYLSEDAPCNTCCLYDPNDLSVFFEDIASRPDGMPFDTPRQGCYAMLENGEPKTCLCGPSTGAGRVEESSNSDAPSAAPSAVSSVARSAQPSGSLTATSAAPSGTNARVGPDTCLPEGAVVDADPNAVCDYSNCCSGFCGCVTNPNSVVCRCSPEQ